MKFVLKVNKLLQFLCLNDELSLMMEVNTMTTELGTALLYFFQMKTAFMTDSYNSFIHTLLIYPFPSIRLSRIIFVAKIRNTINLMAAVKPCGSIIILHYYNLMR